jgi:hypothetical protein
MADTKISQLPAVTALTGAELVPVVQGGVNKTATAAALTGADGADGADGRTILSGIGAPAAGTGEDGDFYLDTSASDIYGPKASGVWGSPTSLIGPAGADGADATYSDATPQALGTAAAGTAESASRADHVHAMPDLGDLGDVDLATAAPTGGDALIYDAPPKSWVSAATSTSMTAAASRRPSSASRLRQTERSASRTLPARWV